MLLLEALKILDKLDIDNNYKIQPSDIKWTESTMSNWTRINLPPDLYLKFKYCYNRCKS